MCRAAAIAAPEFKEAAGATVVTFKVDVGVTTAVDWQAAPHETPQVTPHEAPQVTPQVGRVLRAARKPASREALQRAAGIKDREHFRGAYLRPLIAAGLIQMTVPDKPQSRLQRYRLTPAGERALRREGS